MRTRFMKLINFFIYVLLSKHTKPFLANSTSQQTFLLYVFALPKTKIIGNIQFGPII